MFDNRQEFALQERSLVMNLHVICVREVIHTQSCESLGAFAIAILCSTDVESLKVPSFVPTMGPVCLCTHLRFSIIHARLSTLCCGQSVLGSRAARAIQLLVPVQLMAAL